MTEGGRPTPIRAAGALLAGVLLLAAAGGALAEGRAVPLFVIERSKNANVVHYDARLDKQGRLDDDDPVDAYWMIHTAKKPHREELGLVERIKAYGFDIDRDTPDGPYLMTLAAYPEREIKVYVDPEGYPRAELLIDGKSAFLEKLYIDSTEGLVLPKVNYVELFGRDVATGEPRHEKILSR